MASSQSSILTAFNDHYIEFINDIIRVFPNDPDIMTAKNAILMIRKANPKMTIIMWNEYFVKKYRQQIEAGDIDFFITHDYVEDVLTIKGSNPIAVSESSDKIIEAINRLRNPVRLMTSENKEKSMKYIQNLTKLAILYNS
jgi:hypothetical protein